MSYVPRRLSQLPRGVRTACALLIAITTLCATGGAAVETASDPESFALRERITALEARLGALEAAGHAGLEAAPGDHALLDRLAAVERRLARLEQIPAAAPGNRRLAGVPARGAPEDIEPRADLETGDDEPQSMHSRDLFLPSRGSAGGALHYGAGNRSLELHAFLDLDYVDAEKDGERGGVSTFDNHHANIFVRSQLRNNLLAHIEIEYEHSGDKVEIDQAFLSWTLRDAFSLDAGRFYTPFGIERFVWYSPTNALVSRPLAMRQIIPGNFYANGLRASGLVATRGSDRFVYEVALTDGLGGDAAGNRRGSRQTRDNNSSRALSARLAYAFWPRFEIGTSIHTQRYADDADLDLTFFGLDFAGRFAGFEIRAEYVDAEIERADSARGDLRQDGLYAQLAYAFQWDRAFVPELKLVGRYDVLDLDGSTTGNDDVDSFTFGLSALIYEHFRIKAEYQFAGEDGPARDDDAFRMQFVIDY